MTELNFGFWVALFAGRYDVTLWRSALFRIFPKGTRRKQVHSQLSRIRDLRNRIAHHEPILDHNLPADYQTTIQLLKWLYPDAATWIAHYSRFNRVWTNRP
ncbi:hypothetical protein [Thalassoporum mexicanum]|uniref:hypothetical protein n=1 Tax=Thalassoporum mexicanum TaxID=3457544 RepID=UPI0003139A34|nr:hypothetical protein [Pseudanabaena sp. PCC 7367]